MHQRVHVCVRVLVCVCVKSHLWLSNLKKNYPSCHNVPPPSVLYSLYTSVCYMYSSLHLCFFNAFDHLHFAPLCFIWWNDWCNEKAASSFISPNTGERCCCLWAECDLPVCVCVRPADLGVSVILCCKWPCNWFHNRTGIVRGACGDTLVEVKLGWGCSSSQQALHTLKQYNVQGVAQTTQKYTCTGSHSFCLSLFLSKVNVQCENYWKHLKLCNNFVYFSSCDIVLHFCVICNC